MFKFALRAAETVILTSMSNTRETRILFWEFNFDVIIGILLIFVINYWMIIMGGRVNNRRQIREQVEDCLFLHKMVEYFMGIYRPINVNKYIYIYISNIHTYICTYLCWT